MANPALGSRRLLFPRIATLLVRAGYHAGASHEQSVGWALDAMPASVQDMRVDHRRLHVAMAQQLLDRADIVAGLEEVSREAVAQGVRTNWLGNPGRPCRVVDGALGNRLVEMKPLRRAEARVGADLRRREDPLPASLAIGVRVLPRQGIRKLNAAESRFQVAIVKAAYTVEVRSEVLFDGAREHGDAILVALALSN